MADQASVISIRVSEDGDFYYEPSVKNVKQGQSVTWTCAQGPFALSFKDQTPFAQLNLQATKGDSANAWSVTSHPARVAAPGHFHYAVALYVNGRVYLDAGCPEIVVGT